ncbi:MAG: sigma-54-dependent Fis family transcriptional regulator [Acidobacteria bacterium]|nr:sigma-54-dependent Fis family transcriptional regulator [Acidobacteriota bacterium]
MSSEGVREGTREPLILVVDDDAASRKAMALALETDGRRVEELPDAASALTRAGEDASIALVVTDLRMPGRSGLELAQDLASARPDVSVLLVTAHADVETILSARSLGTVDYVAKPVAKDDLRLRAAAALFRARQAAEIKTLRERLDKRYGFEAILGVSKPMERLFERLRVVAPARTTVLVVGESGTGKELVANALHHNSPRRPRAFVALNCGAIPKEIIESELFGHERGAFTGALVKRTGRIEQAHGGTLFLDEVSEMPPDLQVKFLRVLEERRVTPVGGNESREVDFRLVAATNRDLPREIEAGRFRQDLYYRLSVVTVELPALRDRKDDLPLLVERFRDVFAREHDRAVTGVTPGALSVLAAYDWPGNVRELKNVMESAVLFAQGSRIDVRDLPEGLRRATGVVVPEMPTFPEDAAPERLEGGAAIGPPTLSFTGSLVGKTMAEIEKEAILTALQASGGNRKKAAERLDIGLRTLQRKLKEYRGETGGPDGDDDVDGEIAADEGSVP